MCASILSKTNCGRSNTQATSSRTNIDPTEMRALLGNGRRMGRLLFGRYVLAGLSTHIRTSSLRTYSLNVSSCLFSTCLLRTERTTAQQSPPYQHPSANSKKKKNASPERSSDNPSRGGSCIPCLWGHGLLRLPYLCPLPRRLERQESGAGRMWVLGLGLEDQGGWGRVRGPMRGGGGMGGCISSARE